VADGFDDVARAGFALCTDHGGAFGDAAEGLTQVAAATDEGSGEGVFLNVVDGVGGGEDFGFVDVVDAEGFKYLQDRNFSDGVLVCVEEDNEEGGRIYLTFDEMPYPCLRHDGNGNSFHYIFDHLGVRHSGDTTLGSDVCGDSLKGHNGAGAGFFCYSCLSLVSDSPI